MKNIIFSRCFSALLISLTLSCTTSQKISSTGERQPTGASPQSPEPYEPMAIIGDAGLVGTAFDNLRSSISEAHIRSLILPGDNLYLGSYSGTWKQWKREGFRFDVVAIGNHHKGYGNEVKYFEMPGEYYSVVKNGARFIVTNSDNQTNLDAQFDWLKNELNNAHESLIFMVYHHPTYSVGSDDNWKQREQFQIRMRQVLNEYQNKISALILGHAHISAFMNFGSIPVIVAGAGREVLKAHPVSYQDQGVQVQTLFLAPREEHWAELEISRDAQEARFHFIRVADHHRTCSAHLAKGQLRLEDNCK